MQHGHSNETSSMVLSHGDIIFSKFDLTKLYFLNFFDILRSESNTTVHENVFKPIRYSQDPPLHICYLQDGKK